MENLLGFKKTLEQACSITAWNPTSAQLQIIAAQLAVKTRASKNDVVDAVSKICPGTRFIHNFGVDYSDLRTVIEMAIQVARTKG